MPDQTMGSVLVVDDEEIVRTSSQRLLEAGGYRVATARGGREAVRMAREGRFDLVITDMRMPGMDGIEVLRSVREEFPETEVIVLTGYGTVASAVTAMKIGAFDFLEKPFSPEDLMALTAKAIGKKSRRAGDRPMAEGTQARYELGNIVGFSRQMQGVFHLIATVSNTGSTVLITGESGTGKDLVARAIHHNSARRDRPFVPVDCVTIPETLIESELFGHVKGAFTGATGRKRGLIESAEEGTLFFDEIGNLNLSTQAKLLRFLQEREFRPLGEKKTVRADVRFVAATNKDLRRMTHDGTFREDLFYRLNIFPIAVPPLRERKEDIPHLVHHFLQKYSESLDRGILSVSAEAMGLLVQSDWPGNVRQLENAIHRAAILCQGKTLGPEDFEVPDPPRGDDIPLTMDDLKRRKKTIRLQSVETIERSFLMNALSRNNWNITRAASDVGMQRTNFHALLKKHRITKKMAVPQ